MEIKNTTGLGNKHKRLEMLVRMQIEILNGGEILVNWSNREPQISRYLPIQIRIQILVEFDSSVSRGTNSNPDFGLI